MIKAVAGRYFSLMVFGFSQVALDVEPLVRIIRGDAGLHGFTHTYLGATLIGLASAVVGRPICQLFLNHWTPDPYSPFMNWLRGSKLISWPAAIAGAFVGTYSHVFLDSVMHSDMQPLAPLSEVNLAACHLGRSSTSPVCALRGLWRSSDVRDVPRPPGCSCWQRGLNTYDFNDG